MTMTVFVFLSSGHVCLATSSLTSVLVEVTNTDVASEAAATTIFTSASVACVASIESGAQLHGTSSLIVVLCRGYFRR